MEIERITPANGKGTFSIQLVDGRTYRANTEMEGNRIVCFRAQSGGFGQKVNTFDLYRHSKMLGLFTDALNA